LCPTVSTSSSIRARNSELAWRERGLATGMLEAIRSEGGDADAMLERAIRIDEQV